MRSRFFSIAARISSARPAASNISQAARSFATASFIRGDAITSAFQAYSGNGYQKNYGQWILGGLISAAALASQIPTVEGAEMERTFIAIKPDGVQRGLISEIVSRFERKGYKLVAIKLVVPTKEFAQKHYDDLKGRPFFDGLCTFLSSGPVVAMVWEGQGVIKYGRKLIGATSPQVSEPGTIRGDLAISVGRNIIHGSDGPETAKAEIELWFKPEELISYGLISEKWLYES